MPRITPAAVGLQAALGGLSALGLSQQVAAESQLIGELARGLGPQDGLIAPWHWGARVAVVATADPYGLRWRDPDGFLQDQQQEWCGAAFDRVALLPPGTRLPGAIEGPDARGVYWLRGDHPAVRQGC
jgi:hypothetical protein